MKKLIEFGTKRENEERRDGGFAIVFDPQTQLYAVGSDTERSLYRFFSGGVAADEDIKEGILREVVEESGLNDFIYAEEIGQVFTHYRNVLKNVNRSGMSTCILVVLKSRNTTNTELQAHEKFTLDWKKTDELLTNWKNWNKDGDFDHWIYFLDKTVNRIKELGYDQAHK
jgi:ADP-ribose pyrophosphatase YjhB (NUDIX family)